MAIKKPILTTLGASVNSFPKVQQSKIIEIIDAVNTVTDTVNNITDGDFVDGSAGIKQSTNSIQYTVETTLTATEIVGTDAGDLGHASGATIVAAPGAGYSLQFVSAALFYTFDTAAYTGGGDDLRLLNSSTGSPISESVNASDLLTADADAKVSLSNYIAASPVTILSENAGISLASTAFTNPGTAAGTLRVVVTYIKHTL